MKKEVSVGGVVNDGKKTDGVKEDKEKYMLPGDVMDIPLASVSTGKIKVGPGLKALSTTNNDNDGNDEETVVRVMCTVAGVFKQKNALVWVDSFHKHATPGVGDYVIGIVHGNAGENYSVDIGMPSYATLHSLAFEHATKRNRPHLKSGDLVYAKLSLVHKFMEPEITCVHASGRSNGMGPLEGGYIFECPLGLCRSLLSRNCSVLQAVGERIPFEITVGRNGRVWVKTDNPHHTILIANAIRASERLSPLRTRDMVKEMLKTVNV
eukprot:m.114153 g.114153  ORF g.114153 m.114153 type:complete len:266 (-) comp9274_c2_seq3:1471-2268(-)